MIIFIRILNSIIKNSDFYSDNPKYLILMLIHSTFILQWIAEFLGTYKCLFKNKNLKYPLLITDHNSNNNLLLERNN